MGMLPPHRTRRTEGSIISVALYMMAEVRSKVGDAVGTSVGWDVGMVPGLLDKIVHELPSGWNPPGTDGIVPVAHEHAPSQKKLQFSSTQFSAANLSEPLENFTMPVTIGLLSPALPVMTYLKYESSKAQRAGSWVGSHVI